MKLIRQLAVLISILAASVPATAQNLPTADADFTRPNLQSVVLGQLLFYDPILSGNKSVSCGTCHHPKFSTSDGVALGLGDGGVGLGPDRKPDPNNPPEQVVPRNAPALFNLGTSEFNVLFHDGRLEADKAQPFGIRTPLGLDMEGGFTSILSAQTMFPVLSADEMAGHYGENLVAKAVRQGLLTGSNGAWALLSQRVTDIPAYRARFDEVIGVEKSIHFSDISNAIADFVDFEWRADDSPFDRFLRHKTPLNPAATTGMKLFYGRANCSSCHSGQFQTDHKFHAIGMPQIGPGKAAPFEQHTRDEGRMRVTGDLNDSYRFRTPSLRNVTRTTPYGHSGAYANLRDVIAHHADPAGYLGRYEPPAGLAFDPENQHAIAAAISYDPAPLSEKDITQIIAFLTSLEDQASLTGRLGIPKAVPSGLPVGQ